MTMNTGEVNCKPAAREWAEAFRRSFGADFFEINSEEELAAAVASPETAAIELKRFFKDEEIFDYEYRNQLALYASDEY